MTDTRSRSRWVSGSHAQAVFAVLLAVLTMVMVDVARAADPPVEPSRVAAIDGLLVAESTAGRFAGSVLVARGEEVLINKGFGLADREWEQPATPKAKFRIGSLTKQFTAAAVLRLQDKGKLSVDNPICKYLDHCPESWQPITIHQLLSHQSGIRNRASEPDFALKSRLPLTPKQIADDFATKPLEFAPGTQWKYSNTGYTLLGLAIERVSGVPYAAFLRSEFFEPLGMTATGYDDSTTILQARAAGYERTKGGLVNAGFLDMTGPFAAGAMYSTTEDLRSWAAALHGGRVLTESSYRQMTAQTAENGARFRGPGDGNSNARYGYGVIASPSKGGMTISHGGSINGFSAYLRHSTSNGVTIVVLANIGQAPSRQLADRIADMLED